MRSEGLRTSRSAACVLKYTKIAAHVQTLLSFCKNDKVHVFHGIPRYGCVQASSQHPSSTTRILSPRTQQRYHRLPPAQYLSRGKLNSHLCIPLTPILRRDRKCNHEIVPQQHSYDFRAIARDNSYSVPGHVKPGRRFFFSLTYALPLSIWHLSISEASVLMGQSPLKFCLLSSSVQTRSIRA